MRKFINIIKIYKFKVYDNMKNVFDFSTRYDRAGGMMLKICLLCLICLGGSNISLQAKTGDNESVKM